MAVTAGSREATLSFPSVTTCDGTASVVYVRGKAKPGFELNLKVKLRVSAKDDSSVLATGRIQGSELADYDGYDFDWTVSSSPKEGITGADARRACDKAKDAVTEVIRTVVGRMAEID